MLFHGAEKLTQNACTKEEVYFAHNIRFNQWMMFDCDCRLTQQEEDNG